MRSETVASPLSENGSEDSLLCEYNFEVKYEPGKQNVLADALSCMPDYELAHVTTLSSPIEELIRVAYSRDS